MKIATMFVWGAALVVFIALVIAISSMASAEDLVAKDGQTIPSTMVIRGRHDEVLTKQKFVVGIFLQLVERSPFELHDIIYTASEDGFLTGLVPVYNLNKPKTPQNQQRVLIFTRDTTEMRAFLRRRNDETFWRDVLRNDERAKEVWEASWPVGGRKTSVFIWVKTGSLLVST